MPEPSVSVVVPTHQRGSRLLRALTPLLADPATAELIVVADSCSDDTVARLTRLKRTEPRLVIVSGRFGGDCASRQVGLDHATQEVVVWIDDDVVASPGLISGHAMAHQKESAPDIVLGYMPVRLPGKRGRGQFPARKYARVYEANCRRFEQIPARILDAFWAGNFSLRSSVARRVGLRVPEWPGGYYADKALGLHWQRLGLTAHFERGLLAHHEHFPTLSDYRRASRQRGLNAARLRNPSGRATSPDVPAKLLSRCEKWLVCPLLILAGRFRLWWLEDRLASVSQRLLIHSARRQWRPRDGHLH